MCNVAVVGATGVVGRKMLEMLEELTIPVTNLFLFATQKSAGTTVLFQNKVYVVEVLTPENIAKYKIDYALFSAGSEVSRQFAPLFVLKGAVVIDNSSCYRMQEGVPLVVPEVNPQQAFNHNGVIANPNCSTIQAVVALSPLRKRFGLKRVIYSTYQAVSGAGKLGIVDLEQKNSGENLQKFPHQIYQNVLPHIDVFLPNGYTKEEEKMIHETRKILGLPQLAVTATCVRVPVVTGHSESVNVTLEKPFTLPEIYETLKNANGVVVIDDPSKNSYPMPLMAEGKNQVFVGRIRRDDSQPNTLNMWVVADNLRKGAATNAVQILQLLLQKEKNN